ncbi:MAG: phosphomannomutase/phosphoglucomutase [Euryarchaeota archaeon]|nr:phosphomannomutase/phosphoglucomutase [Euryarchaeota archaeon]
MSIFKAYDIRGRVPQELNDALARDIGGAFGSLWPGRIVVGHDVRLSSPRIRRAFTGGLLSTGCEVVDAGLVATPMIPFAIDHLRCTAGVSITASHNPPDYNGFKLFGPGGVPISYEGGIRRLEGRVKRRGFRRGQGVLRRAQILPAYSDFLLSHVSLETPGGLRVVVDGANGPAGVLYTPVLSRVAHVYRLFCKPDGRFPNHEPDPAKAENLQRLGREVKRHRAHAGFGYDGDGDRLGVVDDRGRVVDPGTVFALLIRDTLARRPGAKVVHDVLCSRHIDDVIEESGGVPVESRVGHTFIAQRMADLGAPLGGELSGHYYFAETGGGDDALFASLRLLDLMAQNSGRRLSRLCDELRSPYLSRNFRVDIPDAEKFPFVERLKRELAGDYPLLTVDGVKILFPRGWALIRPSNTEPKISIAYEASDRKAFTSIEKTVNDILSRVPRVPMARTEPGDSRRSREVPR